MTSSRRPSPMTREEATARFERCVDVDPRHRDAGFVFSAADEALKTLPTGVDPGLLERLFDQRLGLWPEVRPALDGLSDDALSAFLRAAPRQLKSVWAQVLGRAARKDVTELRTLFTELTLAAAAAQSAGGGTPEELAAIRSLASKPALVAALREVWPDFDGELKHRRPVGWAGVLMHEGSKASVMR